METKLTACDLMVGDWVNIAKPHKVTGIQICDGIICVQTDYTDTYYSIENYEPIPLTAEILENNEFEWRAYGVVLAGEDMALVQCGDYWKIKPNQDSNDTFCYIWYVHELQHALRLCGIEKNIII